jgi:CoA:oxalate CoA-transferase
MVRALGQAELEKDPRFASARVRSDNNIIEAEIVKQLEGAHGIKAVLQQHRPPLD